MWTGCCRGVGLVVCLVILCCTNEKPGSFKKRIKKRVATVEVEKVRKGAISLRRTYGGSLVAPNSFEVASKISGRVSRLDVDLGDVVNKGQVIAKLDDTELVLNVKQARADHTVAKAQLRQVSSALNLAEAELARIETLRKRGISSQAQLDTALAAVTTRQVEQQVALAQKARAKANLEVLEVQLAETQIKVTWSGDSGYGYVAKRLVTAGQMISASAPMVSIVVPSPLICVIYVTERDYKYFKQGLPSELIVDTYPGETFAAHVKRISPIFAPESRQARIELEVENQKERLKPGMFARAQVILHTIPDATLVPEVALTRRDEQLGVFVINEKKQTVRWQPINMGIQDNGVIEVLDKNLSGRVVTVGQNLLDNGVFRLEYQTELNYPKMRPCNEHSLFYNSTSYINNYDNIYCCFAGFCFFWAYTHGFVT